jgi:hypothetical protein
MGTCGNEATSSGFPVFQDFAPLLALSRRPLRTVRFKRKKCQVNSRTSEFPQIRDDLALDKRFAKAKIADIESIHALTLT